MHLSSLKILTLLWKNNLYLKCFDFLQVLVPSFLYFALFTFHIFFFTKLNLKPQFEIDFLPPNNGGKKCLKNTLFNLLFTSPFFLCYSFLMFLDCTFLFGFHFIQSHQTFNEGQKERILKNIFEREKSAQASCLESFKIGIQ